MYVLVRQTLKKCTEKSEGVELFDEYFTDGMTEHVRLDFDGIMNVTDDFLFAFLSLVKKKTKVKIKDIQYVRTATYIKRKFKEAIQKVDY